MKFPKRECAAGRAETEDIVWRPSRRLTRARHVGRQETAVTGARVETLLRGRLTQQHLRAIERANRGAGECLSALPKHIERDVIRVRPDPHLRVVRKIRVRKRIAVPRAGRIAGVRDGYALQIWRRTHREL